MPSICAADQGAGRTSPASQAASPPGDRGHLASALDVGGQELSTRGGSLGLVELVSEVRVHDGPLPVALSSIRRTRIPGMDTRAAGYAGGHDPALSKMVTHAEEKHRAMFA